MKNKKTKTLMTILLGLLAVLILVVSMTFWNKKNKPLDPDHVTDTAETGDPQNGSTDPEDNGKDDDTDKGQGDIVDGEGDEMQQATILESDGDLEIILPEGEDSYGE